MRNHKAAGVVKRRMGSAQSGRGGAGAAVTSHASTLYARCAYVHALPVRLPPLPHSPPPHVYTQLTRCAPSTTKATRGDASQGSHTNTHTYTAAAVIRARRRGLGSVGAEGAGGGEGGRGPSRVSPPPPLRVQAGPDRWFPHLSFGGGGWVGGVKGKASAGGAANLWMCVWDCDTRAQRAHTHSSTHRKEVGGGGGGLEGARGEAGMKCRWWWARNTGRRGRGKAEP